MSLSVRPAVDSSIEERIQSSSDAGPRPSVASPRNASDVFDQENFDATAYINEMFPTGPLVASNDTKILCKIHAVKMPPSDSVSKTQRSLNVFYVCFKIL